jgi:DMSO/TMAO reductase YedYZ molybdopterin-dependent catalytic subunit
MNGQPLPEMYGAPLRLRVESMYGYTMVKWVRSGSLIHDYTDIGTRYLPRSAFGGAGHASWPGERSRTCWNVSP